jgi:hypothetical protein
MTKRHVPMRDHAEFELVSREALRKKILEHKTSALSIERWGKILQKEAPNSAAKLKHDAFMAEASQMDKGLKRLVEGIEFFCRGYEEKHAANIGNDSVCSKLVAKVINAVLDMLIMKGNWDGATIDASLRYIAKIHDIKEVEQ